MVSTGNQDSKINQAFSGNLLRWYATNARAMPWRIPPADHANGVRPDPYHVWLSEVMLQQTQVATVVSYFNKFVDLWPTVHDLAAADLEDVLKAWAGLGYYSRARNLKKCADTIVMDYNGKFPNSAGKLKKLPGIGDYTAAAIASIAFDQAVPVMDGNVERVMSRHFGITTRFPAAKSETRELLAETLDPQMPGEFAQAMMDLGATVCIPKKPICGQCPLNLDCLAHKNGNAELFPFKEPKKPKPTRKGAAFVIRNHEGNVFLCKRSDTGLLAGMTQVPTTGWTASEDGATSVEAAPFQADWQYRGIAKHTFTHFHLELEVWSAENVTESGLTGWWCPEDTLSEEAIPKVIHKVLTLAL